MKLQETTLSDTSKNDNACMYNTPQFMSHVPKRKKAEKGELIESNISWPNVHFLPRSPPSPPHSPCHSHLARRQYVLK
jgi:hypothetical protein